MSFQRAARAARAGQSCLPRILVAAAVVVILAGLFLSCGSSSSNQGTVPSHNAYVTLPATGQVLLLHINGSTGAITAGPPTPAVQNISPTGLALLPSKKFRARDGEFDAVVAMYHDQGHIALKLLGMHQAVNVTLGLPIIRTSVAHGTAFDIAWKRLAETSSMIEALRVASHLVTSKARSGESQETPAPESRRE